MTSMAFDHDYGRIISPSWKITKEHAGNETGVARQQTGVSRKIPVTADSVRMKDQHCAIGPRVREFRKMTVLVSHNPTVGH